MAGSTGKPMQIRLNGEACEVTAATVAELVVDLGLEGRMIAVECNLEVVPKSCYADTALHDGDRIEIVHMIGGG
ncbi:MAG TPA: sulfur carrier protein ThiS [Mariprofundaceae bacterium]|nr:sulfur carrier protein ThiS [Mariprofundaceae bacterium]